MLSSIGQKYDSFLEKLDYGCLMPPTFILDLNLGIVNDFLPMSDCGDSSTWAPVLPRVDCVLAVPTLKLISASYIAKSVKLVVVTYIYLTKSLLKYTLQEHLSSHFYLY